MAKGGGGGGKPKVSEFYFESREIVILKKSQGKSKEFNTPADLMPLKLDVKASEPC